MWPVCSIRAAARDEDGYRKPERRRGVRKCMVSLGVGMMRDWCGN